MLKQTKEKIAIDIVLYPSGASKYVLTEYFFLSKYQIRKLKRECNYMPKCVEKHVKKNHTDYYEHNFGVDYCINTPFD